MSTEEQHLLLWKGRQFGPFNIEQIREKLFAGDINRMHQIQVDDHWQILDDYLEKLRAADLSARMRDSEMKREFDAQLIAARASGPRMIAHEPQTAPGSQLSPVHSEWSAVNSSDPFAAGPAPSPFPLSQSRMSGFAITAFVMGICCFIPFVNFISWILAIVFGHIALSQMNADDSLKGRGLAIAGLAITYFLLVMVTTVIVLCLANNKPLPIHF
jgi:hypothetical protein